MKEIINFLCAESGSHDYTLNAREASELGLKVELHDDDLYKAVRQLHLDFRSDLMLGLGPINTNCKQGALKAPCCEF